MKIVRFLTVVVVTIGLLLVATVNAQPLDFDLVIHNGRVVDGTGNPWFVRDVAIQGDRFVAVRRIPVREHQREIDATDLVVAPGSLATTDDLVRLCEVVARYGGIHSTDISKDITSAL